MFDNIDALLKLRRAWNTFSGNHPGVAGFVKQAAAREIGEGTIVDVKLTFPDGEELKTNMKVGPGDIELFRSLREIGARKK